MSYQQMKAMIAGFGEQLRWASDLDPVAVSRAGQVLVAGMGGSGISGDFAAALADTPVFVNKSYGLPTWVKSAAPLVVAMSYSGNTEETLSAAETAAAQGLIPAVVTGGGTLAGWAAEYGWPAVTVPAGLQPRAALGYLLGGLLHLLNAAEATAVGRRDLLAAADIADSISGEGGSGWTLAADLAQGLEGRIVAIYGGGGITSPVAQRWKTQINENAKWPAWYSALPELDHNEIVSWSSLASLTRDHVGIVSLRDRAEPPGVTARFRHTSEITGRDVAWIGEVWSQGDSALERMVSLASMGDLVSLELARLLGVDPVAVDAIENLKRKLTEDGADPAMKAEDTS
ncbi:MAG TPA: bifunctional phosphoglucose/phosphomannose isomerase [Acidimicrobiia bacterium]|nr:bifunctional phosphoglucose/phosphomannose isomerase [Acidimicrobiia bacterium]